MRMILFVLVALGSTMVWQTTVLAGVRVDSAPISAAAADTNSGEKDDDAGNNDEEPECD